MLKEIVPIPQPPKKFMVGNALELAGADTAIEGMMKLSEEYGPIYQLETPMMTVIVVTGAALAAELCDDRRCEKKVGQTLTIKPEGLYLRLEPRPASGRGPTEEAPVGSPTGAPPQLGSARQAPLLVLYGSNLGASEAFARRIGNDGASGGFEVRTAPLDEYVDRLPREGALIIVCSSYNGTPPDNAAKFCAWLDQAAEGAARDVRYAVFGCGNREWAATYQAVPSRIDARLEALGGIRIAPLGAADANDDFDGDFERWDHELWPQLNAALGLEASPLEAGEGLQLDMEVLEDHHPSPFAASFGARPMTVVANDELHIKTGVHGSERSTRHIEVALPEGVTYAAGDHLGVIPQNDPETVKRVAKRFGLLPETRIRLRVKGRGETSLPVDQIVSVGRVLTEYVELGEVATRRQITRMAEHTECPPEKQRLLALCGEDDAAYRSDVLARSKSLVDLLEDFPGCAMPFDVYLAQLSPLKPRYYSISSSPLHTERICSVTVGVVEGPARCGRGRFRGACSNYLARTPRGKSVYAFVRDTRSSFRMPGPATPMIMVGPGTGLAPFRGFVQERAAMRRNGDTVGRSLLFFGCRHPEQDYLYREELEEYAKEGVITLHVAFSRVEDRAYVQDLIRREKDEVWALLEQGAGVYVCGDASRMAPDVRAAFVEICREKSGRPQAEAEAWVAELEASHRYLTDVWAAGSPVGS